MADFNDDTKKPIGRYFTEGVHKVTIQLVEADKTQDGKEFFEFSLLGEEGEEGTARVYWTEKASPYSFNTVRDIFVHNTPEAKKQAIRDKVDATSNTDELLKLCATNLIDKECWFKVEKTGTQYTNANGELKDSYNKNIYGYEVKMKKTTEQILEDISGDPVDLSEIPFN